MFSDFVLVCCTSTNQIRQWLYDISLKFRDRALACSKDMNPVYCRWDTCVGKLDTVCEHLQSLARA